MMAEITLDNECMHTYGELPALGVMCPDLELIKPDLTPFTFQEINESPVILNVYPSLDTEICFESVMLLNSLAAARDDVCVCCISTDLPFALQRILQQEPECFENVILLSDYKNRAFGEHFGLLMTDGCLGGMLARALIVLNAQHQIVYEELITDIASPPNYEQVIAALDEL